MSPRIRRAARLMRVVTMTLLLVGFYRSYRGDPIPWLAFAGPLDDAGFGPRARSRLLMGLVVAVGLLSFAIEVARTPASPAGPWRRIKDSMTGEPRSPVAALGLEFAWFLMMLAILHQGQYGTMS